jgi:putative YpdA family bacillithiol system oxidoreductase
MEGLLTAAIFLALLAAIALPYWLSARRKLKVAAQARTKNAAAGLLEPATLHPRIDLLTCIGCGSCVEICPENVLGIVGGRAAIVHGMRCVGHALCVDVCPVGAITMGFGKPRQGMEIPWYDEHLQTNIPGLYVIGELGGIGLIRNAIEQGKRAIAHIGAPQVAAPSVFDVAIIGAGPAGFGAALAAQERGLRYVVFEQYDLGGSLLHYPRQKLVLTQPVELPLYGRLKSSEIKKEELLRLFNDVARSLHLNIHAQRKVETLQHADGQFVVRATGEEVIARNVILALGRRGSPRKLGVEGEELPKVAYQLIEAESYQNRRILVVGGGDSAIEAAVALSRQRGNVVTVSYRKGEFVRLKEKNERAIAEAIAAQKIQVYFNSEVAEIRPGSALVRTHAGSPEELGNDFVFIFAGGELPAGFLKAIGVALRTEEVAAS